MSHTYCDCSTYSDLRLQRSDFAARLKATKGLSARLALTATHPDGEHSYHSCSTCGQSWQRARALHFGTKPYFFAVPTAAPAEWLLQRFVDPDEVFAFVLGIDRFLDHTRFSLSASACSHVGCACRAIAHSVHCLSHHVQALQSARLLPRLPDGRWFGPYEPLGPEAFTRYLAEKHDAISSATAPAV